MDLITICDWNSEDKTNIQDIVQHCESLPSEGYLENLDENKCISLIPPDLHMNYCSIKFRCSSVNIKNILIISESSLSEVYVTEFKEYYQTFSGNFIASFEDSHVYKTEINLKKPTNTVEIYLKRLVNPESLWLYGLYVQFDKIDKTPHQSCFSEQNLTSVFNEKDVVLSDRAQNFQKLLGNFNNECYENPVISTPGGYKPSSLIGMMMANRNRPPNLSMPISIPNINHSNKESINNPSHQSDGNSETIKEILQGATYLEKDEDMTQNVSCNKIEDFISKMQQLGLEKQKGNLNKSKLSELLSSNSSSLQNEVFNKYPDNSMAKELSKPVLFKTNDVESKKTEEADKLLYKVEFLIDKKITEAENRIIKHIDKQVERINLENNSKLDEILKFLKFMAKS